MTRQELDSSFEEHYRVLIKMAKQRCELAEDAMDVVHTTYARMCDGTEYMNIPLEIARTWWVHKVREIRSRQHAKTVSTRQAERVFAASLGETVEQELVGVLGEEVLVERWQGMTRKQQERMRKKFTKEGRPWYLFMEPKQ